MDQEKAVSELQKEIDKIDFAGGLIETPTPETPEPKPAEKEEPATPAETPESEKETPVKEESPAAEVPESTPEKVEESKADEPKTEAIPDSHYRAALHMGYKPEEIGELYDANPALALKTLAKCYEQVNATSRQLGELGQKARQLKETPAAQPQPQPQPQPSRKDAVMKKLREKYEDDPIIDLIGELIPDQTPVPEVKGFKPQTPEPAPQPNIDQEIAVRQQINTFFSADEMDVYGDFYGKTAQTGAWDTLTPGQRANRIEVCNRAQNILDGAEMAGMRISAAEALERAHLEVAAPMAEQIVRERIVKSVQKRAAGVTLKPSGSKTPDAKGGKYNKEQAIADVAAEVKKVFG